VLHPYDGETEFNYDGQRPPYDYHDVDKSYPWLKSPHWKGKPIEILRSIQSFDPCIVCVRDITDSCVTQAREK